MSKYKLIAYGEASRIERATSINPDELREEISTAYRFLLIHKQNVLLYKERSEIILAKLIEERRAQLEKEGKSYTEASLKTYGKAHREYSKAINKWHNSSAVVIKYDTEHKNLQKLEKMLYKEASLAREELFSQSQKQ